MIPLPAAAVVVEAAPARACKPVAARARRQGDAARDENEER